MRKVVILTSAALILGLSIGFLGSTAAEAG